MKKPENTIVKEMEGYQHQMITSIHIRFPMCIDFFCLTFFLGPFFISVLLMLPFNRCSHIKGQNPILLVVATSVVDCRGGGKLDSLSFRAFRGLCVISHHDQLLGHLPRRGHD
jgi:hypothetical protein